MKINISGILTRTLYVAAAVFMAVTVSCTNDDEGGAEKPADSDTIGFGISTDDEGASSRAMIGTLEDLNCKHTTGAFDGTDDPSERIGVVADLHFKNGSPTQVRYINHLLYDKGTEGWKYYERSFNNTKPDDTQRKRWVYGTNIVCSAYYPARFMENPHQEGAQVYPDAASGNTLKLSYSAILTQKDILVGYNVVDADTRKDKDGKVLANRNVIPLEMTHALSAIKFQFWTSDESNNATKDKITKVWLDDTGAGTETDPDYFTVLADLNYETVKTSTATGGDIYTKKIEWIPGRSQRYQNYIWEYPTGLEIPYGTAKPSQLAVPYATTATNKEGKLYCENNGYILVVPQKIAPKLYLCFQTTKGKGIVTKKSLITDLVKTWEPNKRYTYTIKISAPHPSLIVEVEPWKEINSNASVEF